MKAVRGPRKVRTRVICLFGGFVGRVSRIAMRGSRLRDYASGERTIIPVIEISRVDDDYFKYLSGAMIRDESSML